MNSESRFVLLVGTPCASCDEAARIWHEAAATIGCSVEERTIDLHRQGSEIEAGDATALPALLFDGETLVVGVPKREAAAHVLRRALAGN